MEEIDSENEEEDFETTQTEEIELENEEEGIDTSHEENEEEGKATQTEEKQFENEEEGKDTPQKENDQKGTSQTNETQQKLPKMDTEVEELPSTADASGDEPPRDLSDEELANMRFSFDLSSEFP